MKWLILITRQLTLSIPISLLLGFGFGIGFDPQPLTVLILPFTMLMVYPMMVGLDARQLLNLKPWPVQWYAQGINFLIIPLIAFALGLLFFGAAPGFALGLLLAGLLPTSGMTISWTGFAQGNVAAAIKLTVVGLILGALLAPFYLLILLGADIPIALGSVFRQIIVLIFVPLLLAQLTRLWLIRKHGQPTFKKTLAPKFPPFSALGVLGIVFVAMSLQASQLLAQPSLLLWIIPPVLLLYGINFIISLAAGYWLLPREDAIALVYGTVMRNLSIALALAMNLFGELGNDAALVIALAFIIQVQAAAWSVRLTTVMFGPPKEHDST
jgi:ACR3 family arsenite efflux pump ArsB